MFILLVNRRHVRGNKLGSVHLAELPLEVFNCASDVWFSYIYVGGVSGYMIVMNISPFPSNHGK